MERWFCEPVRPGLCRLQDAEADTKTQRGLFPRNGCEECGGVKGLKRAVQSECAIAQLRSVLTRHPGKTSLDCFVASLLAMTTNATWFSRLHFGPIAPCRAPLCR